jgi:hypothetical protein
MPADVTRNLSAASRVAHMDRILEVKLFRQHRKIVGVRIHVVAVPRLRRTAVASAVVRDDTVAPLSEEKHL